MSADDDAVADDAAAGAARAVVTTGDEPAAPTDDLDTGSGTARRFTYLPALDGLRGIGIIMVLFWHNEVTWLGDGALFVLEAFFVLSGFLITSLFLVEHERTSRVSLKNFWRRRFRRLGPALIPMFAIITLYVVWAAQTVEVHRIQGDGIATFFYVSNWRFIFSGESYFETFAAPSPFLHTWSLAIEEQFYLLIAVAVFLAFRRWGRKPAKAFMWVAAGFAVLSALWMAFLARMGQLVAEGYDPLGIDPASMSSFWQTFLNFQGTGDPSRMYYGTDTRLQGSLIGVALAFLVYRTDLTRISHRTFEICMTAGIGLTFLGWFGIQSDHASWIYYGGWLVMDVILAVAVIGMLSPRPTVIGRMLAWKPLLFFGGLSYSIYVLHFPIYVWLTSEHVPFTGWQLSALRMVVSVAAAYLSVRFFENHIRAKGLPTTRAKLAMGAVVVLLGIAFLTATVMRSSSNRLESLPELEDGRVPIMIAGDSQPQILWSYVNETRADYIAGLSLFPATQAGCGLIETDYLINGSPNPYPEDCYPWRETWSEYVQEVNPAATLVLAWGWDVFDRRMANADGELVDVAVGSPEWNQLMTSTVQEAVDILSAQGGDVILLTLPCFDLEAPTPQKLTNVEAAEPHRVAAVNTVLTQVAADNPEVTLIDLNGFLCPGGNYTAVSPTGDLLSPDGVHFTKAGAINVWNWLLPQLYEALEIEAIEPVIVEQPG